MEVYHIRIANVLLNREWYQQGLRKLGFVFILAYLEQVVEQVHLSVSTQILVFTIASTLPQ